MIDNLKLRMSQTSNTLQPNVSIYKHIIPNLNMNVMKYEYEL